MFKELQGFNLDEIETCADEKLAMEEIPEREIAIIGMAVQLPLADHLEAFWANLLQEIDCIRECPETRRQDLDDYLIRFKQLDPELARYFQVAYLDRVDQFDYAFFGLSPKEASLMDPHQRLFLEIAWKALEDAGYGGERLRGSRTGVYVGLGGDGQYKRFISEVEPESLGAAIPGNIPSVTASRIAYLMDFRGPSLLVDTACSSSLVAVHHACQALRNGDCQLAIAGSVKIHLVPLEFAGSDVGIRSSDGKTRTFDDRSDGTGYGEGAVAVLLKPLHRAMEDGDHIYAVIKGTAINQDGSSVGITAPNPAAQEDVIIRAWKDAGVEPETIRYIEAHGTGTKLGDPIEINGVQRAFATYTDKKQFCAIGSVKTNIGHLDYAAGVAGLVKAALCLQRKVIPATINFKRPNQKIRFEDSPVFVNDLLREWEYEGIPRRCGVSAFGISGTNCHLVLEEAPEQPGRSGGSLSGSSKPFEVQHDPGRGGIVPETTGAIRGRELFTLSAKSISVLRQWIADYISFLRCPGHISLADLCYTANLGRGHYRYRLALVVDDLHDLLHKLEWIETEELATWADRGIYFAEHLTASLSQREKRLDNEYTDNEKREHTEAAKQLLASAGERKNQILDAVAQMYVRGAEIDWLDFYHGEERYKVSLPTYPFERNRCWLEIPLSGVEDSQLQQVRLTGHADGEYSVMEQRVAEIWGHVLGYRELNVCADFYAIGGDSVSGLNVVKEVTKRLQIPVQIFELLRVGSLTEFAQLLEERQHVTPETAGVGISIQEIDQVEKEGSILLNGEHEKKLFCFPPRMGQGLVYKQLAVQMKDYAVYAFNFIEAEDRMKRYVDEICKIQEVGPYLLVGYSAGGSLVFDVARELERRGQRVEDVILFDSANLEQSYEPTPEILQRIQAQFRAEVTKEFPDMGQELLEAMVRKQEKYYLYLMRRGPLGQIHANIHLILAENSQEAKSRLQYVVDLQPKDTTKNLITYQGYGQHDDMLFRGAVEENAKVFQQILTVIAQKPSS